MTVTQTPDTGALLTRLRAEVASYDIASLGSDVVPSELPRLADRVTGTLKQLDQALSAGASVPDAWRPGRPLLGAAVRMPDTVAERMSRGRCPSCSAPGSDSAPDGTGGHTWTCSGCDRTWRSNLSADDLHSEHYALLLFEGEHPLFSIVGTDPHHLTKRAAELMASGYRIVVQTRNGQHVVDEHEAGER
ncbi:hypothetical protein [Streptomyces sp. TR02-1]|uniref:hypothetical protein n=1 Tax=Streptomyces sp. TR02-1 TaxID=3385977 RepID=UPI0039A2D73A